MTWDEEELEPRQEWTPARRLRVATFGLVALNLLGILMLGPIGDSGLQEAAAVSGSDDGPARERYWIAVIALTLVGNGVGTAAAAAGKRWAITGPVIALIGCWATFAVTAASVSA